jgi:hypothetical protein
MTPNEARLRLADNTLRLAAAAPGSWSEFTQAIEVLAQDAVDGCLSAPPDVVLRAQGRAQYAREFVAMLKNARNTLMKTEQRLSK